MSGVNGMIYWISNPIWLGGSLTITAVSVGTRGQGLISGLLLGSVTQRLLQIAPCAVLAAPLDDRS